MNRRLHVSRGVSRLLLGFPLAGLLACNAILGAGDYHVGNGDAGTDEGSGGESTSDDSGAGGSAATGGATGSGGRATGGSASSGGRAATGGSGSGGRATAGTTGSGGRGAGGGKGTGGTSGALTPDDFIGEWDCPTETVVTDCGDGNPSTDTTADSLQWTSGTSTSVRAIFQGSCNLEAALSGRVLTISPPISCVDSGITYLISGTFTVQANGTATLDERVTVTTAGVVCNVRASGTYTKYVAP